MSATKNGNQSIYAGPGLVECPDCKGSGEVPVDPEQSGSAMTACKLCKGEGERRKHVPGLTKREAFAQTAHAGMLSSSKLMQDITAQCAKLNKEDEFFRVTAEIAVDHADALLEALDK